MRDDHNAGTVQYRVTISFVRLLYCLLFQDAITNSTMQHDDYYARAERIGHFEGSGDSIIDPVVLAISSLIVCLGYARHEPRDFLWQAVSPPPSLRISGPFTILEGLSCPTQLYVDGCI